MTKTAAVTANGRNFWAYDVSISFLAHEMLAVGREQAPGPWFDQLAASLTGVATSGGTVGLDLEPVVEAGEVEPFVELVRGQLPKPPPGTWWFLGLPTGPRTIKVSDSTDG